MQQHWKYGVARLTIDDHGCSLAPHQCALVVLKDILELMGEVLSGLGEDTW